MWERNRVCFSGFFPEMRDKHFIIIVMAEGNTLRQPALLNCLERVFTRLQKL
jgi:hypothetical protein